MAAPRIVFISACTVAALGAGTAMVAGPAPAQAQGLFDLLGRIFRGAPTRSYQPEPPRLLENFPRPGPERAPSDPGGPSVSFCVRLCDGRYFPLPRNADADERRMCSAMCPATQTKIFSGPQIDQAVSSDGQRYENIEHAFLYREQMKSDCTCTGRDPTGVAAIDALKDPTLQPGDVVVTADGAKVFRGGGRRSSAFVPVQKERRLPKDLRRTLSELRIAPERLAATAKSGAPASRSVGATPRPAFSMAPDSSGSEDRE